MTTIGVMTTIGAGAPNAPLSGGLTPQPPLRQAEGGARAGETGVRSFVGSRPRD